jgi:hypothetical protein
MNKQVNNHEVELDKKTHPTILSNKSIAYAQWSSITMSRIIFPNERNNPSRDPNACLKGLTYITDNQETKPGTPDRMPSIS